ncbi:MAG: hypothetical protein K5766_03560 [Alphaproteobacteria bacterium]|nr:hypothetical protein [Alphaproteobacteria bacterium]
MNFKITGIQFRSIFNSNGGRTIEVGVCINDNFWGTGSAPAAIKAGRLEKIRTDCSYFSNHSLEQPISKAIVGKCYTDQKDFDDDIDLLNQRYKLGSDLTLSLSIAFCRASASLMKIPLFKYISDISQSDINMPYPMANIFSGGVHSNRVSTPFQQIMVIPKYDELQKNFETIVTIYSAIEKRMKESSKLVSYSSSSGMLVHEVCYDEMFKMIHSEITKTPEGKYIRIGVDVAAEHLLLPNGNYVYNGEEISPDTMQKEIIKLVERYNIFYIEDPFDSKDSQQWKNFSSHYESSALIVGDDLFATNANNIEEGLANGILLKMNQIGSISGTLAAAKKAKDLGLTLCVSHRSLETEDTAMCDLAVGIGAEYIKIGGPRRGDRISKYNQLIRINELIL